MDTPEGFLNANEASFIAPLLRSLNIRNRSTVYLPADIAIEFAAEHYNISIDFILTAPKFVEILHYGVNPRGFKRESIRGEENIDVLTVLAASQIGGITYKILDGILAKGTDLDDLAASYRSIAIREPAPNRNVENWLLLPKDIFVEVILSNKAIRGKQLLALCISNREFNQRCDYGNQVMFRNILRREFGIVNVSNPRELYERIVKSYIVYFGTIYGDIFRKLKVLNEPEGILQVSCGPDSSHAAILDLEGHVWTLGDGTFGALGYELPIELPFIAGVERRLPVDRPRMIPGHKVKQVSCGFQYTAFLDTEGQIWTFGNDLNNKLGRGVHLPGHDRVYVPTIIPGFRNLKYVACGQHHTAFLDAQGQVWTFGLGTTGQLGHGNTTDFNVPTMISGFKDIKQISCGSLHTAFLDAEGCPWTFGYSGQGQTGHRGHRGNVLIPTRIPGFQGLKEISCGVNHTAFLDAEGQIWTFGNNMFRKLGHRIPLAGHDITDIPTMIPGYRNVKQVRANKECTIFLTQEEKLMLVGLDSYSKNSLHKMEGSPIVLPQVEHVLTFSSSDDAIFTVKY